MVRANNAAELQIDSVSIGKTFIHIYGKCYPYSIHSYLFTYQDGEFVASDTLGIIGVDPFVVRLEKLQSNTGYNISFVVKNFLGQDTFFLGRITTLSDFGGGGSSSVFKITNHSLTRASGSTKMELRGFVDIPARTKVVAYATIFADSLCTIPVAPISTKLNYSNNSDSKSLYNLYYDFYVDTNSYQLVWGKFWGSDDKGNSVDDSSPVKLKVFAASAVGLDDLICQKKNNIKFYPVPAKDYLFLEKDEFYVVYDMNGRKVTSGDGSRVDLSSVCSGFYTIETKSGWGRFWKN